jgi:hypothetical protein
LLDRSIGGFSGLLLVGLHLLGRSWLKPAYDGLEREFNLFNYLRGCVCTTCAPRDQVKSIEFRLEVAKAPL